VNQVNIGLVDLNNGQNGGDRYTSITINSDIYPSILANSTDKENITIVLLCAYNYCHAEVPWVVVTNGLGQELYNGCPSTTEFTVPLICK
jgi:hypothetical protein